MDSRKYGIHSVLMAMKCSLRLLTAQVCWILYNERISKALLRSIYVCVYICIHVYIIFIKKLIFCGKHDSRVTILHCNFYYIKAIN